MSIRNSNYAETNYTAEQRRMRRKADQAWDMAGLARQDRDTADEVRRTAEAREWERKLGASLRGEA